MHPYDCTTYTVLVRLVLVLLARYVVLFGDCGPIKFVDIFKRVQVQIQRTFIDCKLNTNGRTNRCTEICHSLLVYLPVDVQ